MATIWLPMWPWLLLLCLLRLDPIQGGHVRSGEREPIDVQVLLRIRLGRGGIRTGPDGQYPAPFKDPPQTDLGDALGMCGGDRLDLGVVERATLHREVALVGDRRNVRLAPRDRHVVVALNGHLALVVGRGGGWGDIVDVVVRCRG